MCLRPLFYSCWRRDRASMQEPMRLKSGRRRDQDAVLLRRTPNEKVVRIHINTEQVQISGHLVLVCESDGCSTGSLEGDEARNITEHRLYYCLQLEILN